MGKPLTCWLGRHKWVRRTTEDGARYQRCSRCGQDDDGNRPVPGAAAPL